MKKKMINDLLATAGVSEHSSCELRRIGTDDLMVEAIIERIVCGEKTMTYSLPWLASSEEREPPEKGRLIVVLGANGTPRLLLRLNRIETLAFGEIGEGDIQQEGVPLRQLAAWRPLHIAVWNEKLQAVGRRVDDRMPVWAEYFDLLAVAD